MSKRIGIGRDYALAFGFTWQTLDPIEPRGAKVHELLEQGNRWEASFKLEKIEHLGVSKDDFTPIKGIRTLSGAGQMAMHPNLCGKTVFIAMENPPEDDGQETDVAVVGLLNGNIIVDDVIPARAFSDTWGVFLQRCQKASQRPVVAGCLYTITQAKLHMALEWTDFVPPAAPAGASFRNLFAALAKKAPVVRVKALEPAVSRKVVGVLAAGIGLSLAGWGYVAYQNQMKAEALRAAQARALADFPARYAASVDQLLSEPVMLANTAFKELRGDLLDFPVEHKGWKLNEIDCGADGTCRATWTNAKELTTNREFIEAAPKSWGSIELKQDGKTLSHQLPFKLSRHPLAPRAHWPDQRTFLTKNFSQWQQYWVIGFHPYLDQPKLMGTPPGDPHDAESYPAATFGSKWGITKASRTPWYLSEGFDKAEEKGDANLGDNVTVQSIKLTLDGTDINFEAEGLVYARK